MLFYYYRIKWIRNGTFLQSFSQRPLMKKKIKTEQNGSNNSIQGGLENDSFFRFQHNSNINIGLWGWTSPVFHFLSFFVPIVTWMWYTIAVQYAFIAAHIVFEFISTAMSWTAITPKNVGTNKTKRYETKWEKINIIWSELKDFGSLYADWSS